jgi:hypothetical protein
MMLHDHAKSEGAIFFSRIPIWRLSDPCDDTLWPVVLEFVNGEQFTTRFELP